MSKLYKIRRDIIKNPEKYNNLSYYRGADVDRKGKVYITHWRRTHRKFIDHVLKMIRG